MKKLTFLTVLIFALIAPFLSLAQEDENQNKWYSTIELDVVSPYEGEYHFGVDRGGDSRRINTEVSFGALYSINYILFSHLSIGAVVGYQVQFNPDFHLPKIGAVIRYFFVDPENVYIYLQDAHIVSFNTSRFEYGNNFRFGIGFPVWKRESFNLNTNLFFEQNYIERDSSEPLLPINEDPGNMYFKAVGLSLGLKF